MKDRLGREINNIRISVTDRCNLRSRNSMPAEGIQTAGRDQVLDFDEIVRVASLCGELGMTSVRLTGGEPLVRKDIALLVKRLKELPSVQRLTMTTNGLLFEKTAGSLSEAGLDGVNISLDTLDRDKYTQMTGTDGLFDVLKAAGKAWELGMKVKINTVMIDGFNDGEAADMALMAADRNIDVRFIEMMPLGRGKLYTGPSCEKIMEILIRRLGTPERCFGDSGEDSGPARYFRFPGMKGRIGFISAVSRSFCKECNKMRLTASGRLKPCLQYGDGKDLREPLRTGAGDMEIKELIKKAVLAKPQCHRFGEADVDGAEKDLMAQIGG